MMEIGTIVQPASKEPQELRPKNPVDVILSALTGVAPSDQNAILEEVKKRIVVRLSEDIEVCEKKLTEAHMRRDAFLGEQPSNRVV